MAERQIKALLFHIFYNRGFWGVTIQRIAGSHPRPVFCQCSFQRMSRIGRMPFGLRGQLVEILAQLI
ncbi:MAG: hypothetical protein SO365_03760, partial [Prevotella sp.]|nr:hypothetical protein [Prevotella sp.]